MGAKTKDEAREHDQQPEPEQPEAEEKEERRYATRDSLGVDDGYEDIQLPILGGWIRVRYLQTPEIAQLQFLPDLVGFAEMVQEWRKAAEKNAEAIGAKGKRRRPDAKGPDPAKMAAENYRYEAYVAHLSIMDPDRADEDRDECSDCNQEHPPALWSVDQTLRLQPADLDAVAAVALRSQAVSFLGPFSAGTEQSGSPAPADSGA